MNMTDVNAMRHFIRMCNDGWLQGWHERNGGNLTYRLPQADVDEMRPCFAAAPQRWTALHVCAPNLAGEYFITTGSGRYMRNVALEPESCLGVVEINPQGDGYRTVWGLAGGGCPTSEFPSHFMNHSVRRYRVAGGGRLGVRHGQACYGRLGGIPGTAPDRGYGYAQRAAGNPVCVLILTASPRARRARLRRCRPPPSPSADTNPAP